MKIDNGFDERPIFGKNILYKIWRTKNNYKQNEFQMDEAAICNNIQPYEANTDTSRIYQDLNFPQRFECPCKFLVDFGVIKNIDFLF